MSGKRCDSGSTAGSRPLMAGTKRDGLGQAVFHAADQRGIAVCGRADLGSSLELAAGVPANWRCRAKACQTAFTEAGV